MPDEYDIFISYAHEDVEWIRTQLHEPLLRCRTARGKRPRIFLDISREGIPAGKNYQDVLANALERSEHILPVYSKTYFSKEMCGWELSLACALDPKGRGRVVPILMERDAASQVPFKVSLYQYLDVTRGDWFERLLSSLSLTVDELAPVLEFIVTPATTIVNHTLPEVQVALVHPGTGEALDTEDPVTISAVGAELQGTTTMAAAEGFVSFGDLSFATVAARANLVVESPGCTPVVSAPIVIREPPAPRRPPARSKDAPEPARPSVRGTRPVFFSDGETVIVHGGGAIDVVSGSGMRIAEASIGRVRLLARGPNCIAVADWSGRVALAHRDGRVATASFAATSGLLTVPGGLCVLGDEVYVGFWNGEVRRLALGSTTLESCFAHSPGVAALQMTASAAYLADLDGRLVVIDLRDGGGARPHDIERAVLAIKAWPDAIVAIGERSVYRLGLASGVLVQWELSRTRMVSAFTDSELALAVDAGGRGVRFDSELTLRGRFHTTRGARIVDADAAARVVVFAYPDATHAVLVDERVVFNTSAGAIAVAADGRKLAFVERGAMVVSGVAEAFGSGPG